MAVKIRLARRGRKKRAMYDVVVADARAPRDGRFIEKLGRYNPNTDPAFIDLNEDRAFQWVMDGAQPTDTVRTILSHHGILLKKHLQVGVNKGAITQEEADKKFQAWKDEKEAKITAKKDKLAKDAASSAKARQAAEAKVKEARAELLKKRAEEAVAAEAPADTVDGSVAEATQAEEVAEPEVVEQVAEAKTEEAPEESAAEAKSEEEPTEVKVEETTAEVKEEAKEEAPAEEAPEEDKKEEK